MFSWPRDSPQRCPEPYFHAWARVGVSWGVLIDFSHIWAGVELTCCRFQLLSPRIRSRYLMVGRRCICRIFAPVRSMCAWALPRSNVILDVWRNCWEGIAILVQLLPCIQISYTWENSEGPCVFWKRALFSRSQYHDPCTEFEHVSRPRHVASSRRVSLSYLGEGCTFWHPIVVNRRFNCVSLFAVSTSQWSKTCKFVRDCEIVLCHHIDNLLTRGILLQIELY